MTSRTETDAYHYRVIARALDIIDSPGGTALTLEALADRVGLSPAHFQRVFSRWAGVSPKRYQQYLALDHARRLLAARHTTLDVGERLGLSGTGRLHDLFVTWEAMTPGEYARAAGGLTIRWAWCDSPFGPMLAMATDRGLCALGFSAVHGADATFTDLAARWPGASFTEDRPAVEPLARRALSRNDSDLPLHVFGGPFQRKVWEALLRLPPGRVTTYADIAAAVGNPGAHRAVGTAVGRNPLAPLIPCHRVLRRDGALGGYRWGLPIKRAMLARESAQHDNAPGST